MGTLGNRSSGLCACALHYPAGRIIHEYNRRAVEEGAALSAKVQKSEGACVLVSEQFHVELLRVRVLCT